MSERSALESLHALMAGNCWFQAENWCSNESLGFWTGIQMSESEAVVEIHLSENNIRGNHDSRLAKLCHIHVFSSLLTNTSGQIPELIGNLSHLQRLRLAINEIAGIII